MLDQFVGLDRLAASSIFNGSPGSGWDDALAHTLAHDAPWPSRMKPQHMVNLPGEA